MKKWIMAGAAAAILAGMAVFVPPGDAKRYAKVPGIAGRYVALVDLKPHALNEVHIDLYADFTCPACQRLENEGLARLKARYGGAVLVRKHYLAGPATAPAAKILYDVAVKEGKGDVVADVLFKAKLSHGNDQKNLPVVRAVASKFELLPQFEAALSSGAGRARIQQEWKQTGNRIVFFPFVVFEDKIAADGDIDNLLAITDSLLRHGNAQSH